MDRESRLVYCSVCMKRRFIPEKGIVCSLTNEWASFDNDCPDFEPNEEQIERNLNFKTKNRSAQQSLNTFGLIKYGIKSGTIAGILIITSSALWFVYGILELDIVFIYPLIFSGIGFLLLISEILRKSKQRKDPKSNPSKDILDN